MDKETKKKLILAILQGDDYADTVDELNQNGFFATILSSTGGFLKKKSVTVMIGVEEEKVQQVLDILKQCAGHRQQMMYSDVSMSAGGHAPQIPLVPVPVNVGGVVVFILDLEDLQKF